LFTPDERDLFRDMGRIPGFGEGDKPFSWRDGLEVFPDERDRWNSLDRLILFNERSEDRKVIEERKQQETFNECEKGESKVWKNLKPHGVYYGRQIKTNDLKGKKKEYYGWDDLHKEIEVYDSNYRPTRAISPVTGRDKGKDVNGHKDLKF